MIQLIKIAMALKPGQSIVVQRSTMYEAAAETLTGLDRMRGARRSDIKDLVEHINKNWGICMTEDAMTENWTMHMPAEGPPKINATPNPGGLTFSKQMQKIPGPTKADYFSRDKYPGGNKHGKG